VGKYTLRVMGRSIEDALRLLEAADGIKAGTRTLSSDQDPGPGPGQVTLTVTVDAPTLAEAESRVEAALPKQGSYTVGRPDPVEDDD
jgi:hypothetical protein